MARTKNKSKTLTKAATPVPPNLFVVNLGPGDFPGFDIDFPGWTGNQIKKNSNDWISQGYEGILFKGAGRGITKIVPAADATILVGRHNGIVAFQDLSIGTRNIVGKGKAIHMGTENPNGPIYPKFKCSLNNVEVYCHGNNSVWGLFGYQCDWEIKNCVFNLQMLYEHGLYAHGYASKGVTVDNLTVNGVGAECLKFTARPHECKWVKNAVISITNSTFKNWYQPWSWRGGAGLVAQACAAHIRIENCYYWGDMQNYNRSKCVMIDGNSGGDYHINTGAIGNGPSTGHVFIKHVAMVGAIGPDWYLPIMRIGNLNSTNPWCALSLRMEACGVYGRNRHAQLHGPGGDAFKGAGYIRGCNTPEIRDFLIATGMVADVEAKIDRPGGFINFSQGIVFNG